jgi:hypothetical protein
MKEKKRKKKHKILEDIRMKEKTRKNTSKANTIAFDRGTC